MFETLDPQDPPVFGADAVSAVRTKARRMRRRKQAVTGVAASGACAALVGTGLAVRWGGAFNRIDKVTVAAADPKADSLDRPMNTLVVGWDTRTAEEQVRESVSGTRPDVIRLVRIDPVNNRVTELAIPRFLAFADGKGKGSVWSNYSTLDEVAKAVERIGLPVDHAISIDMAGFADVVDSLGGIRLSLEVSGIQHPGAGAAIIDRGTGLRETIDDSTQPQAGTEAPNFVTTSCRTWSGAEVMALVRSRHAEVKGSGFDSQWIGDGDVGRIARQTQVGEAIIDTLLTKGIDVSTIDSLVNVAGERLERDPDLGVELLVQLGMLVANDPELAHTEVDGVYATGPENVSWIVARENSAANATTWAAMGSTSGPTALSVPDATPDPPTPPSAAKVPEFSASAC